MKTMRRIENWHVTIRSAESEAKLRQLPIVEVEQPKGRKALYSFGTGGRGSKLYYVVTTAPKTLIDKLRKDGVTARRVLVRTKKAKRKSASWA